MRNPRLDDIDIDQVFSVVRVVMLVVGAVLLFLVGFGVWVVVSVFG